MVLLHIPLKHGLDLGGSVKGPIRHHGASSSDEKIRSCASLRTRHVTRPWWSENSAASGSRSSDGAEPGGPSDDSLLLMARISAERPFEFDFRIAAARAFCGSDGHPECDTTP